MQYYKLTNEKMQTYGDCQWTVGVEKTTDGTGDLCSPGWLHCYNSPLLAILLNPIGADFLDPRLFKIKTGGKKKTDRGLKFGFTKMSLTKEIPVPVITVEQKIKFAILCALKVCKDRRFRQWAKAWLSGKDRSYAAARAARAAADAARAARAAARVAYAAADAAGAIDAADVAYAAARVANAATYAADAAAKGKTDLVKLVKKAME